MTDKDKKIRKFTMIILAYPLVLILIGILVNLFAFSVQPVMVALPVTGIIFALVLSGILLAINHTWLMTATELTRLKYNMYATPEEWDENGVKREQVSQQGWSELERHHNAHRNATENVVYFVFLAFVMSLISPTLLAAQVWMIVFAVARLGYTYCYLNGMSGARGIFMSFSLLSIYGLASYLAIGVML